MNSFSDLLQQGAGHGWLFVPSAILLGALHGLEPGHSKTMMAAFIVAVRGTAAQALLLGLAATASHTLVVWAIAIGGMYLWQGVDAETFEPYFQLASAAIIIAIATWMIWRTYTDQQRAKAAGGDHGHWHDHGHSHDHGHAHGHDHGHAHDHGDAHDHEHDHGHAHPHAAAHDHDARHSHAQEHQHGHAHAHAGHDHTHHAHEHHDHDHANDNVRRIDTGHGIVAVALAVGETAPHWSIRTERGHRWAAKDVTMVVERPDGSRQGFAFADRGDRLESLEPLDHPHDFMARLSLGHGGHTHDYDLSYLEGQGHDHLHEEMQGLNVATDGYQDAHELAHANDIRRRFADRNVTTWQIILFGLTGGLIPRPAAITVLLLCLQLKQVSLGFALVLCFSIGLAITLVTVGVAAALSVRHATKRWSWFSSFARRAPYFSGILIIGVGLYVAWHGWVGLAAQAAAPVAG